MKRIIIFVSYLLFFLAACEKDHSPTKPEFSETGTIRIVIEDETNSKKSLPDSLSGTQKPASPETINLLEVGIDKPYNLPYPAKAVYIPPVRVILV